jgi:glycosyltransferase involved in cell wall biosynthesis
MVPANDLRALYRLAQFMIFPSLFEAAGGPLVEAWKDGTPVACSAVTSLPEQAGDAALMFDPLSVESIADAVYRIAKDASMRDRLRQRGLSRLQDFSWNRTARSYRAVYRRAACCLTEEDRHILTGGVS